MSGTNGAFRLGSQPIHVSTSPIVSVVHSGEIRVFGLTRHAPLYLAALKGDWKTAKAHLIRNPEAASAKITRGLETALHIAAGARHTKFVEKLVGKMTPSDLAEKNRAGNTALCFAVASGVKQIAEAMVRKNPNLPFIRGNQDATPLYMAALLGHRDMVWYLYSLSEHILTDDERIELLVATITSDLFDVALDIIRLHPDVAIAKDGKGETALHALARKPSVFNSETQLSIWKRFMYSYLYVELPQNPHSSSTAVPRQSTTNYTVIDYMKILFTRVIKFLVPGAKNTYNTKLMHNQALELTKEVWRIVLLEDETYVQELIRSPSRLLFTAAELGIVEFIVILIRSYPDLIWKVDDKNRSIFHIAVMHRQEMIFSLIYEIGGLKDLIAAYKDADGNNILHLAGKLPPLDRAKADSSAALQLRKELRWFKEVEKIVQPSFKDMVNKGKTPQTIFAEDHKSLVTEGEKWMRNTASSCMVVATLIATVMFAAAFTLPGGENNETGVTNYLKEKSFLVFIISDSLSLFSSAMSILTFLSILTSRYGQEDFLDSLPNKLVIGLATLFVSIATMMISFCATLFVIFGHKYMWVPILLTSVACFPVALFVLLQFPLLLEIVTHAYIDSNVFYKRNFLLY